MARRLACLLAVLVTVHSKAVSPHVTPDNDELLFMRRYGYLPEGVGADMQFSYSAQAVAEAVRRLQAFAALPQTGVIDEDTRKLFTKKRCGVKDIIEDPRRKKRYLLQQFWKKRNLTYRVLNGSSTLDKRTVERLTGEALQMWAPYTGMRFLRADAGHADIQVSFVTGNHGDGFPLDDGRGKVLAHAFPPPSGVVHFDDAELWAAPAQAAAAAADPGYTDYEDESTDYFAAAVHELGHSLGLGHSDNPDSVMYPYYQVPVERLHSDDIMGMHQLYFANTLSEEEAQAAPDQLPTAESRRDEPEVVDTGDQLDEDDDPPDICYANYDTMQVIHGKIYVFEEEWVWILRDRHVLEEGSPRRLRDVFPGLPRLSHVRALYQKQNRHVVVFSGFDVYELDQNFHLVSTYNLSRYSLPAYVQEITTAFLSNYNNKTYLFSDDRFWRYDEAAGRMDPRYPKHIGAWRGMNGPVDAVFVWKEDTHLFRGARCYRFDNEAVKVSPRYPLPTAPLWFPCPLTDLDRAMVVEDY